MEDKKGNKRVSIFKGSSFKVLSKAEEKDIEIYKKKS